MRSRTVTWKDEIIRMAEREISLIDLIADILSHWRGALICLAAGVVLAGGINGFMAYQEWKETLAEAEILREEQQDIAEAMPAEGLEAAAEDVVYNWRKVVKGTLLGGFLFLFVYSGIYFTGYLLNGRIRAADELQGLYHISQLGLIVQEEQVSRNIIDRWIRRLRHWNKRSFGREQCLDLAATAIRISARKQGLDAVCLMGCDLKAGAGAACSTLKEKLEKENISIKILDNVLYDADMMGELEEVKGVVLVEKAMSTLYDEIVSELELVSRQGITVLGGIVVE